MDSKYSVGTPDKGVVCTHGENLAGWHKSLHPIQETTPFKTHEVFLEYSM